MIYIYIHVANIDHLDHVGRSVRIYLLTPWAGWKPFFCFPGRGAGQRPKRGVLCIVIYIPYVIYVCVQRHHDCRPWVTNTARGHPGYFHFRPLVITACASRQTGRKTRRPYFALPYPLSYPTLTYLPYPTLPSSSTIPYPHPGMADTWTLLY